MRIIISFLILFVTAGVLSHCSTVAMLKNPPKVKFKDVRLKDTDFKFATLDILLEVANENSVAATVDRLTYDLALNDKQITKGSFDQKVELPAKQTIVVTVPVQVKVEDLFSSALALLQNKATPYSVKGSVGVGLFDIPFDSKGSIEFNKH